MSEQVTEVVQLPLAKGVDLSSGEHQKIWNETLKTIASQPGNISVYWGVRVENPEIAHMVIDWENLAAHKKFESLDIYGPFLEKLGSILGGAVIIFHISLPSSTPLSVTLTAPVTECLSLLFPKSFDPAPFNSNFSEFRSLGIKASKEIQEVVGAWSIEESLKHEGIWKGKDGEEGSTFQMFAGWSSVKTHMEFKETEDFKALIPKLREGPQGVEVFHVEFKKFE